MMKRFWLILLVFLTLVSCVSCSTTIPTSAEAEVKMKELGYEVDSFIKYGDDVAIQKITQVTVFTATKEDLYLQVFFFANEEDTETFYNARKNSLPSEVEVVRKNKYSICRGSKQALEDFLS